MIRKILGCLIMVWVLQACQPANTSSVRIDEYFDLKGLLDEQVELLFNQGARLEKHLSANGKEEMVMVIPDSAGQFRGELQLFYEADINKLGLEDAYFTEELPGVNGGRKVINTAKKEGLIVRLIEYDYQEERLERIRILIEDKNDVYNFEKEMFMKFRQLEGKSILTDFSISGKQQMVMKSDLNFALEGTFVR